MRQHTLRHHERRVLSRWHVLNQSMCVGDGTSDKSASALCLLNALPACRSERMEEQMTYRWTGEGENKSEYIDNEWKRGRKPLRPNHATKVCMHIPAKLELQQERKRFLLSRRAACRSEGMEEQMTDRSTGEGENKSEYTNNQWKREQKPLRPNHATKVCMHNSAKLELQQERKHFLLSQRAACRSERMEEQMNDRSMGQGESLCGCLQETRSHPKVHGQSADLQ